MVMKRRIWGLGVGVALLAGATELHAAKALELLERSNNVPDELLRISSRLSSGESGKGDDSLRNAKLTGVLRIVRRLNERS